MKWKYLVTSTDYRLGETGTLNELGRKGWELVAVLANSGNTAFYLKAPLKAKTKRKK